ncbi:MAG TPA: ATP-dependent metallopeptidase FtsH/Yme1/Tma family protein, partial [Candidatus Udaeobacter sp.]|nr:ATP-dependent metallopeptidase FtsH/Yme1/Tma family protein [Candidatus Udaeobacter sp.]
MNEPTRKNPPTPPNDRRSSQPRRRLTPRSPRPPLSSQPARPLRNLAFWVVLFLLAIAIFQFYSDSRVTEVKISYSEFRTQVDAGNIKKVTYSSTREVRGELREEGRLNLPGQHRAYTHFYVRMPLDDEQMLRRIEEKNPTAEIQAEAEHFSWMQAVITWLPVVLIIAFWLFVIRQIQAGGSTALKFGKSRAKLTLEDRPKVTFQDVAGADEAKEELQEIIEFL